MLIISFAYKLTNLLRKREREHEMNKNDHHSKSNENSTEY